MATAGPLHLAGARATFEKVYGPMHWQNLARIGPSSGGVPLTLQRSAISRADIPLLRRTAFKNRPICLRGCTISILGLLLFLVVMVERLTDELTYCGASRRQTRLIVGANPRTASPIQRGP